MPYGKDRAVSFDDEFVELYRRHRDDVRRYLLAVLRDPTEAEDATQETFARAYQARAKLGADGPPLIHWLLRVARNHAIDLKRRASHATPYDPADVAARVGAAAHVAAPEEALVASEGFDELVATLPPRQRRVLALRFGAGLRPGEVASLLGCSGGSVETLQSRALSALRQSLAPTPA